MHYQIYFQDLCQKKTASKDIHAQKDYLLKVANNAMSPRLSAHTLQYSDSTHPTRKEMTNPPIIIQSTTLPQSAYGNGQPSN